VAGRHRVLEIISGPPTAAKCLPVVSSDLWSSNGPIFVPAVLRRVEDELRETLALAYLLLKMGWSGYVTTDGVRNLLSGPTTGWQEYHTVLSAELL
jgi:hypothetical protein